MKVTRDKRYVFESNQERDLFFDVRDYLLEEYRGKHALKKLVKNIKKNIGDGDFFAGFVFEVKTTLSFWSIYTGRKDNEKDKQYKGFIKHHYLPLLHQKDKKNNLVSFAVVDVFYQLLPRMEDFGLIPVA